MVETFRVHDLTIFSDHCMISFTLRCTNDMLLDTTTDGHACQSATVPEQFIWGSDSGPALEIALAAKTADLAQFSNESYDPSESGIQCATEAFTNILLSAGKISLKVKKRISAQNSKKHRLPKYTDKNDALMFKEMKRLSHRVSRCPWDSNIRSLYFRTRKQFKTIAKKKEREFKNFLISSLNNLYTSNSSEYWKLIQELESVTKNHNRNSAEKVSVTQWLEHFKRIMVKDKNIQKSPHEKLVEETLQKAEPCFTELDYKIKNQEVEAAISKLKNGKASGNDCISNEMLKHGRNYIIPALCKLFNLIFSSGHFPNTWKLGTVSLLHKGGPSTDPNNYRGITVTSC